MIRPIVPLKILNENGTKAKLVYAMLDSGSDRDVVSEELITDMALIQRSKPATVQTVESTVTTLRHFVNFRIQSLDGSYNATVNDALVGKLLTSDSDLPPAKRDISSLPHAKGVTFDDIDARVEMIIGVSHADAWIGAEIRRGGSGQPTLLRTNFGWTIVGGWGKKDNNNIACNATSIDDSILRDDFSRIFYHDFSTVSEEELGQSVENREAIRQLEESIQFDERLGKYIVGLPWKGGWENAKKTLNALDSRQMALKRLYNMVPRFRRDPERKERVFAEMQKFIDKGYAIRIEDDGNDAGASNPRWYLPIHVVEKGKKTRICHDARASVGGTCLNDLLLGGPKLLNSLPAVLMAFRTHRIAFMMDIAAFFHQVLIQPRDADVFRYFWFDGTSMTAHELARFLAHIFGSKASSIVTSFVLRYHAEKIKGEFPPNVYEVIRHLFYVDDGSGGADDVEQAVELKGNLKVALASGGFSLAKWKSNAQELLDDEEDAGTTKSIGDKDDAIEKVLGVGWDPKEDVFVFAYDEEKVLKSVSTPRELVAVQASLFDPAGFICPFLLIGRRMLQKSMTNNRGWDSPLDAELRQDFEKWAQSIPQLTTYKIPRWWDIESTAKTPNEELHIFCDAAEEGYGAVAYRRAVGPNGDIFITIITARSHVVPLNPTRASHHNSIPRLEMTAAAKAVEIRRFIEISLRRKFPRTIMWSDSESVLKQIFDTTTCFPKFFSNRLSKIHAASSTKEWRYVDTKNNPADLTSRGIAAHEGDKWKIFHSGPAFLRQPEENWPETRVSRQSSALTVAAVAATKAMTAPSNDVFTAIAKISQWHSKVRRMISIKKVARFWRQYKRPRYATRASTQRPTLELNASFEDIRSAENDIFRMVQQQHFAKEKEALAAATVNQPDSRKEANIRGSKIAAHNPFVASDDLIRIGSRLANSTLRQETKFPIILPKDDENVNSFIRATHERNFHSGAKQTLSETRQRVWILQGLQQIRRSISVCGKCQRAFKRPLTQKMAPLPVERTSEGAPFEDTGLDLMGPFGTIMNGRAVHKVWFAIFTCFRTRSVHAEMVYKLDASSLINAIVRFNARRPGVRRFISDRGTNLTAAEKILKNELSEWNQQVARHLQTRGLEWSFIPANTPHYGGVWERVVGLFKRHLKTLSVGEALHVDVLNTSVVEIESIVNRRPLTALSSDAADYEAITPAHILNPAVISHSSAIIVETVGDTHAEKLKCLWRRAQSRVNAFWKAWRRDYLTLLHDRQKWTKTKKDMQVGDLMLIVDESTRRGEWHLARVTRTEGTPSHARKAWLKRADGKEVLRDRSKLVHLELEKNDNE